LKDSEAPTTLVDLLSTLEKSTELRSLARQCGLSVKEMRRRLARWRRELQEEMSNGAATGKESSGGKTRRRTAQSESSASKSWPELTAASACKSNPLPRKGKQVLEIWTDGASKGNPGPASIGIVFGQLGGELLCGHGEAIGRATNNAAEYRAVIRALEFCAQWRIKRITLNLDSELIARQLNGVYRVKSPDLRPLYQQIMHLSRNLSSFRVRHVPRAKNRFADYLANQALRRSRAS
jgi:ribonuclease HI